MIVIAGGTGRMGRDLAVRLVERGLPVRVLARDPSRIPEPLRDRVEAVRADVREPATLVPALDGARHRRLGDHRIRWSRGRRSPCGGR